MILSNNSSAMRLLYTVIFYLALPIIIVRLLWRSVRAPSYRSRVLERFGFLPKSACVNQPVIWLHTVSVGETIAAKPLIEALLIAYPKLPILITTMTPTGSEQVNTLFAQQIQSRRIIHSYIPYDLPDCLHRFFTRIKPCIAIFMETEVWPNTVVACQQYAIPTLLINARLSAKSLKGYQRFLSLSRTTFGCFKHIGAQTPADAKRLQLVGANQVNVTGSIKSEITLNTDLIQQAKRLKQDYSANATRPIILAASTHQGEEELLLTSYQHLIKLYPELLLILVPRHPERFASVKKLCRQHQLQVASRSNNDTLTPQTQVLVGDTMGELMLLYGTADIAVVGGSFIEHGGHNLLEPAAWGVAVISGSSVYNFAKIAEDMQQQHALLIANHPQQLTDHLKHLLSDRQAALSMGNNAQAYVKANRGALQKTLALIDSVLTP